MPSVDRRSRLISSEVILQSNNNSNSTNNNHESSEEDNNEDGNGNEAEIPRRFNSSPAALAQQNDGRVRRHPVRSSPSPAPARKVYSSSKAEARLTSSEDEDEDEDEEAEDDNRQDEEGDIASRRCSAGGVAGGATSSPSSVPHQYATRSESPKPTKSGNQSADAVSSMTVSSGRNCVHCSSDSHMLTT